MTPHSWTLVSGKRMWFCAACGGVQPWWKGEAIAKENPPEPHSPAWIQTTLGAAEIPGNGFVDCAQAQVARIMAE